METKHCLHSQNWAELVRLLAIYEGGKVKKMLLSVKKPETAIDFA